MTVRELVEYLQGLRQDLPIVICTDMGRYELEPDALYVDRLVPCDKQEYEDRQRWVSYLHPVEKEKH